MFDLCQINYFTQYRVNQKTTFLSPFLTHPAFRPKMSLCHVLRLSSVHNSQEMLLLPQFFERARACA